MTFSEEERRQLVSMRIAKADHALADASLLAERGSAYGTINRCYYAMFHAATALAIQDNCDFHKHRPVISWFHREYIKIGRLPAELGKAFQRAFDRRSDADYSDVAEFAGEQVAEMLDQARRFVAEVKSILQAT